MPRTSIINRYIPVLLLLLAVTALPSCASRRLARQAEKLEEAGLYEMAAERYLQSFTANNNNIDAATGLRRTGQRTLEEKAARVARSWNQGDDRETVYRYLDALAWHQRIRAAGIELSMPGQARSQYEEAKPRFLDRSFEEARLLLEEEQFGRAETIFSEIKRIDPSYRDLDQYMRVSKSEPLYREGVEQLNKGNYRRAYTTLSLLIENHGLYKDAAELRKDALEKGMVTIAIADFENVTRYRNVHNLIRRHVISELSNSQNPFISIVDDRNVNAFIREQERAARLGRDMEIGRLMAARALLTGKLTAFSVNEGRVQRTEHRGYLREVVKVRDNVTREESERTVYHKVTYHEYRRVNSARGIFEYQLSSTETGAILASGVIELNPGDEVHYAVFEGNADNLVPGHWEYRDRESPKDAILDEPRHTRGLRELLNARQTIKPTDTLRDELVGGLAASVSQAVNRYNPE